MIATSDFKKGVKILFRDQPYMVISFTHVKPGKGGAFVKTKMKNMITGLIHEETFRSGEKFPSPDLEYKQMQYLYTDDDLYHFMECIYRRDKINAMYNYQISDSEFINIFITHKK